MKQRIHPFQKSTAVLVSMRQADNDEDKINILNQFYVDAKTNGFADAEEEYKSESRLAVGKLIKRWFYFSNTLTIGLIGIIFCIEIYNGKLGAGIINGAIILALIGATVTQNAAAFIIYAKYAFGSSKESLKVKSKD
ncbi:MAG: hypothetical protein QM533_10190 [Cytophagales bacterium]|nr:hypothetical protein [Cytophagales bacterium]